ncbi:MAG: glycosyltransferase [Peptococcaceae bacterium]|nr:glycosyltransferase [Peptococcaceae bacterium]
MKVLLITGKFGMGHYSAASTLAEEIQKTHPAAEVKIFDIYEGAFPGCCQMIYHVYSSLVERGCLLYNLAYKSALKPPRAGLAMSGPEVQNPVHNHMLKALARQVESFRPDAVVATYSLCAKLMDEYKRACGSRVPLVTCITDVTSHNVWINDTTDLYLVAAQSTKEELVRRGVEPEKIAVSGIPVGRAFAKSAGGGLPSGDKSPCRELLIMGGGLGLLPEKPEFYQKLNRLPGVHTTVVTAGNRKLYDKLQGKFANITVLGYSQEVDRLMARADLLITKPGGITLFEAIHAELPLLLFRPFLAQEVKNGRFVDQEGLGMVLAKKPEQALGEIACLLDNPYLLEVIRENMRRVKAGLDQEALPRFLSACVNREMKVA